MSFNNLETHAYAQTSRLLTLPSALQALHPQNRSRRQSSSRFLILHPRQLHLRHLYWHI